MKKILISLAVVSIVALFLLGAWAAVAIGHTSTYHAVCEDGREYAGTDIEGAWGGEGLIISWVDEAGVEHGAYVAFDSCFTTYQTVPLRQAMLGLIK